MKDRVRDVRERLTMEHVLLATFIGTSAYMFIESYEFQAAGGMFPRFTSAIVIVLGLLLVFRAYLPAPLQRVVTDEDAMFDVDELVEEADVEVDTQADEANETDTSDEDSPAAAEAGSSPAETEEPASEPVIVSRGSFITGGLCIAYLLASYIIGMLWATPLFVIAYTVWSGQRWYAIVGLAILSFVLAFLFYDVLNLDIASGWIHDWLVQEVL